MKDWEDIIKERQLSRKAELPESDWNDFLSRKAAHERVAIRRRRFITFSISIPAAAAVLLLLFLLPVKTIVPDNKISQNEPSEPQVTADSVTAPIENNAFEEKRQLEIAQVRPQVKPEAKPDVEPKVNTEVKPESKRYSVKGSIYAFDSAEPMNYAAVMIYQINDADTTYIGDTATDENGEFEFDKLGPGNYVARATYIGFGDADRGFTIRPDEEILNLGKITIKGGSLLNGLAVNAVVAKVQMVNDTTKFNMATYKLPEGASVEDLIRKLPGLKIDSAGNITVNGKSLSRILVNDKELGVTSTFKTPLIVFDGNVVEVDKDKLAAFDFSKSYNDRDSLSSLLGVRRGKINVIRAVQGVEAFKEWGPKGLNGVLEVFSGKYYRKSLRAGKLDGGPYEIVPRSKHAR